MRRRSVLGHGLICLGLACVAPGWSQADGSAYKQIAASAITRGGQAEKYQSKARNWHGFWNHHLGTWHGSWTRYTSSGEIQETFASTRQFTANPAKTAIIQINKYRYADGRSMQKKWSYNIKDHNQQDGFAHPASETMRGLALDNGAAAWLIPSLQPNAFAPFELFLKDGDIRHSVGVVYGRTGKLMRTASIREQRGTTSNVGWTDAIIQTTPWHPKGHWQGQEHQIRRNLSIVSRQPTSWQWIETGQSNHFLPDRIILRCPKQLSPEKPFSIQVIWMQSDDTIQTITANYDNNAQMTEVVHQELRPTE